MLKEFDKAPRMDCEGMVFDYSKASNILVSGAPKQGKSTAIRIIVYALKSCPEASEMQFRVLDTSKPHWDADETLGELCRELERRETLHNVGVDISGFPLIVTVINEYSDLVEFGSRDSRRSVKDSVLRLAKEGAGLGIYAEDLENKTVLNSASVSKKWCPSGSSVR